MLQIKVRRLSQKLFVAWLLSLMLLGMFGSFLHVPSVKASPDMFPTDGDAWTENDNATYTWKFHTSYVDTMAWTTSDVHEGSYALNVTHTKASTGMYFRLVLNQNYNVTQYDGIFFWMKATSSDVAYKFGIVVNPTDTNWDVTNYLTPPVTADLPSIFNATWTKVFIPLMVFDASGTASWNSIRQIYFKFYAHGSADGTEVLVDNLHFTTFEVTGQTPTTDQMKIMPMAYYNMKQGQYTETYNSVNYTAMYDWQNLTDNTFSSSSLEIEVLGHTIFALSIAYEQTNFGFYLSEAQTLANWALEFQEQGGLGKGGFHNYFSGGGWYRQMSPIQNGWIMAGLSYLYGVTSDVTYKNAVDLQRNYMCGIGFNTTNNIFNGIFNNDTQTMTYARVYSAMRDGAGSVGLATYYRFVSQNATVLDRLNRVLNTALGRGVYANFIFTNAWEDNAYQIWGMWQAWKATANTTYRDSFLNTTKILVGTYMKHPSLNGSATRDTSALYIWGKSNVHQDGWGLHCSLPLFYLANEIEPQTYFINALELSLFNHLRRIQDDEGGFRRNDKTQSDKQYYGTPSFVVLGSQLYHLNKGTDLYVPASTGRVLNISTTTNTITLSISGTGTTTTYVYYGSNGQPTTVTGATSWSYDSASKICTITVIQSSSQEIVLDWTVTIPGDIDGDGDVDFQDFIAFVASYGASVGEPRYKPEADLDSDDDVDFDDFIIFAGNYGKTA